MSATMRTSEQSSSFSQRRRWLRTQYVFSRKHLDYTIESKREAKLHKRLAWDTIGPRSTYVRTVETDRELHWVAFVMTALAAVAVFRGGPQPLVFLLYGGVTLVALAVLLLTQRFRQVAFTAIPTPGLNVLVLEERNHDAILREIEARRAASLAMLAEPADGISVRVYLRRLRWLVENDVLTAQDAIIRQKLVTPDGLDVPLMPPQPDAAPRSFRQRRLGISIDVNLLADAFTYRRSQVFGTTESVSIAYRELKEPASFYGVDQQYQLAGLIFAWCAIAVFAWMSGVGQQHPEDYYVGGVGLQRAIADYGPALLVLAVCAPLVSWLTRLRYADPYPGIRLLRDRNYEALLAAIEERRVASQRALAEPDPLLSFEEQMQVLNDLYESDVISDEELDRAAKRAAFICDNPMLDLPAVQPASQRRRRAVH